MISYVSRLPWQPWPGVDTIGHRHPSLSSLPDLRSQETNGPQTSSVEETPNSPEPPKPHLILLGSPFVGQTSKHPGYIPRLQCKSSSLVEIKYHSFIQYKVSSHCILVTIRLRDDSIKTWKSTCINFGNDLLNYNLTVQPWLSVSFYNCLYREITLH